MRRTLDSAVLTGLARFQSLSSVQLSKLLPLLSERTFTAGANVITERWPQHEGDRVPLAQDAVSLNKSPPSFPTSAGNTELIPM